MIPALPQHLASLVLLYFTCICGGVAANSALPVTPVVIYANSNTATKSVATIDGRAYDFEELRAWLSNTSNKFGRTDPVIVVIRELAEFASMIQVATVAADYYDSVYFCVPSGKAKDPWLYLLYTPSEPPISSIRWGADP